MIQKILRSNIYIRSKIKKNMYETIDFNFKPNTFYKLIVIPKTDYKIPKIPYKDQYESRDF